MRGEPHSRLEQMGYQGGDYTSLPSLLCSRRLSPARIMGQGNGEVGMMEEETVQKQQARPASSLQVNGTVSEMQPSGASGDFKRALDIVVPATLVIK